MTEPTQTFYAIAGGFLTLAIVGIIWYLFKRLIDKVENISVALIDQKTTLAVHHEKHTRTENDLHTHRVKLDRLEHLNSNLAKEIALELRAMQ